MKTLDTLWLGARATLFWIGFALSTLLAGMLAPLAWLFPLKYRYPAVILWNCFNLWWLQASCGVKYQVWGLDNIPTDSAFILMSNHQSTWETLALPCIFPQQLSWVLKQELLKIPFFGWGLRLIRPIAIDRGAGRAAVKQLSQQGKALLEDGLSVVIFPEGTRVAPDTTVPYKIGGAILASHSGFPVVPVAHNAGQSWPRHGWIKWPGTITVSIGPAFSSQGMKADAINQQIQAWIEAEKLRLPPL
ncbi:lysophospholipid acyltransferase family protein [Candidatus Thiothrix sp. Deng01]|uniref:Lysophospholipid acyltransferase family protein n=1 Tax=Candidatus Thiothrix phosphatis TaxID=3112415 RepID=A0ABU6CW78_9GAMM|nr:lysophospholipid acyltransferase family protein [Candidatus Thiothrix sp. Deng01]MEB4591084.1 lysophospholipid acyltransferase family protein [Candidatus Thiothrix sp. Deng01]